MAKAGKSEVVAKMKELVDLGEDVKATKKDAEAWFDATFEAIHKLLSEGNDVGIQGHGTYEIRHRDARKGRNPQSGEEIEIPASNTVGFKPTGVKNAVK